MGYCQSNIGKLLEKEHGIWNYTEPRELLHYLMGAFKGSSLIMNGPGSVWLHPKDLYGLLEKEAPDR